MKNVHLIPTDKPSSKLIKHKVFNEVKISSLKNLMYWDNVNIYITSDEKSKEGDWVTDCEFDKMKLVLEEEGDLTNWKKIILTTDHDLIADGVQAIDDEFLEWFVKNPSCEFVEVKEKQHFEADKSKRINPLNGVYYSYKIIIPQEEPKQETLEEAAKKYAEKWYKSSDELSDFLIGVNSNSFKHGAKWQVERMYSEEEVLTIIKAFDKDFYQGIVERNGHTNKWFERFKKK
jgi:hypothetical protein